MSFDSVVPTLPLLLPDWPAPQRVRAAILLRPLQEKKSIPPIPPLKALIDTGVIPDAVVGLKQVHGIGVFEADQVLTTAPIADASFTTKTNLPLLINTADCLPVLFCDEQGTLIGAAHAGWRGLCGGILEAIVIAMRARRPDSRLMAWLGPAIGPEKFEVGAEVRAAFLAHSSRAAEAFVSLGPDAQGQLKYLCNLYTLARQRLASVQLHQVYGGQWCTASDAGQFYSYRRDRGIIDHLRSLIWLV